MLYIFFVLVAGIDSAISECKGKWITKAPMPTLRHGLSAVTDGEKIYVIGGWDGSVKNHNEEYDPGVATPFYGLTPNTQYTFKTKNRNIIVL